MSNREKPAQPHRLFPTTRWTMVRSLTNGERQVRFTAWDEFWQAYHRPLQVWLNIKTRNPQQTEEIVQSFLAQLSAREKSLEGLDPARGRLRSWLLLCLKRHWINTFRSPSVPTEELPDEIPGDHPDTDEIYDREWAVTIAARVLGGLRDEHLARGKSTLFDALIQAIDHPTTEARAATCEALDMSSNAFAVALKRFRERLAVRLREEVDATLTGEDPAETDAELRHLVSILSRQGGLGPLLER